MAEAYLQIGIVTLRDKATGEFLPAQPLYMRADKTNPKTGLPVAEEASLDDVSKVFADKMKEYIRKRRVEIWEISDETLRKRQRFFFFCCNKP